MQKQTRISKQSLVAFSLREVTEILVRHYGAHEGIYGLSIDFRIGIGQFGPSAEETSPGASVSIERLGLVKATVPGVHTVDASVCNPAPKRKKTKSPI
jgi:hypothetical protein